MSYYLGGVVEVILEFWVFYISLDIQDVSLEPASQLQMGLQLSLQAYRLAFWEGTGTKWEDSINKS